MNKDQFKWYVAGPMSYKPQFNVPAFLEAKEKLEAEGYAVQLPADLNDEETLAVLLASPDGSPGTGVSKNKPDMQTWGDFLKHDVKLVADMVDGVAVLPGWNKSRGARLETYCAKLCGKPVVYASSLRKVKAADLAKVFAEVANS